jgi:hypothetical protein
MTFRSDKLPGELGQDISIEEAEALKDRKLPKEALNKARLAHCTEIGFNPSLTKEAIVGQIFKLAERRAADREDYKAADSLLELAKVQGWVGAEPNSLWKTFSALSQAECWWKPFLHSLDGVDDSGPWIVDSVCSSPVLTVPTREDSSELSPLRNCSVERSAARARSSSSFRIRS